MRRLLIVLALTVASAPFCSAQIPNCAGGGTKPFPAGWTPTDLNTCIHQINVDGTLVTLPPGTTIFSGTTTPVDGNPPFSFTIQGAGAISSTTNGSGTTGTDQTIFINHMSNSRPMMIFVSNVGKVVRITGVALLDDAGTPTDQKSNGYIAFYGRGKNAIRFDHSHVKILVCSNLGILWAGEVTGVNDHLYVETPCDVTNSFAFKNGQAWNNDPGTGGSFYGNYSWADSEHFGTDQFAFVEDSRITNGYWEDCVLGGRYVVRHSTLITTHAVNHGTHDQNRGCRAAEAYLNTASGQSAPLPCPSDGGLISGASANVLGWGNTITCWKNVIKMSYYRQDGATYGISQAPPNGFGMCGTQFGPSVWDQNLNSTGYACLDVPSRGKGDLLSDYNGSFTTILNTTTGTRTWPHQEAVPWYAWNNTLDSSGQVIIGNSVSGLSNNVDYFMQFGPLGNAGTFNGTAGVGQGSLPPTNASAYSGAPACTTGPNVIGAGTTWLGVPVSGHWGPGYWNTSNNTLYICTATNTWTAYYTPFTYPHPLVGGGGVVPPPPPNAPSGLTGSVAGSTVNLSWTASSGSPAPTAYTLYRGTVHGGPYSVIKSGLTSTSTTDTPPNGTWFYVVAGYVGGIITNVAGSGTTATVTCTTTCAFPAGALFTIGGNSVAGFNVTTTSASQPTSSTFTFSSATSGTGTGGGVWQTASESPKSNEITVGVPASLTVSLLPATRTFASQTVGTTSASQTVTLTNTSGAGNTVTISAKGITTGANPGDFAQTNNCPSLLLSGTNCTFNVTFTPTAAGARSANLTVTDNAAGSPQSVALSGTGVAQAPGVSLNPTSLSFGDQTLSTTSTARSIILTNTGSGTLTISSVVASGDFAVTTVPATNCGGTLASLATCSLNVTFTPTATGGRTGAVTVTDNATGSPHVATLSGNGITTKCEATGNVTLSGVGSICQ